MIVLFYFMDNVRVTTQEFGYSYDHTFEGVTDKTRKNISPEKIYFSTPSDFKTHMENIQKDIPEDILKDLCFVMKPDQVVTHSDFPKHIGFSNLEEELKPFKGKPTFKVSIINAMSNALGDHLVGMNAFDIWQEKVRELLPDTEVSIVLHQLSPYRVDLITKKWHPKFQQVHMLPNRLSRLMEYDAFVDLGGFILHKDFGKKPMMDFYLQALSIPEESVPPERKRIQYSVPEDNSKRMEMIFSKIKSKKRPILLFHHKSSSAIRGMSDERARNFVREIIDKTDYFVVSACGLEYQNKRFMSLNDYSHDLDDFVSIISKVDGIITVDTSTYHFADAFDIPTVVLFTTIDPNLRTIYYPFTKSIMLEKTDGMLFGRHKTHKDDETKAKEIQYIEDKWTEFDITEAIKQLQSIGD